MLLSPKEISTKAMWLSKCCVLVLLVLASCLPSLNATACEERETTQLKLDLLKQSISDAKSLYPKCNDETDESNCTSKDKSLAHLNVALELISVAKINCNTCPEQKIIEQESNPKDCSDVQKLGFNKSGIYEVWPGWKNTKSNKSIKVYCDMETDGGGWTVIQRRGNFTNQTDFYQDWETYKNGFGNLNAEFWLGNENIFLISNQGVYSARFDLVDHEGVYRYALYSTFSVGNEISQYILQIQNYKGNATDDMSSHNNMVFITKDKTKGSNVYAECASKQKAGFWFEPAAKSSYGHGCGRVNLNGLYKPGESDITSMFWYHWRSQRGLSASEIKLRRTYA